MSVARLLTYAVVWGFLGLGLSACKNVSPDADQAALVVNPTAASRAALQQAVNTELLTEVLLTEDALTRTSLLIVERKQPQSIEGSPAQGRNMDLPIQFQLIKSGDDCVLIDQRDQSRSVLADTECVAAQKYQAN
jgi:hypothetical protein